MRFEDWGEISYSQALARQYDLLEQVLDEPSQERVIFCSHPPVVTLGRASSDKDLLGWQGETYEVSRGGKATYHGPGQQVIYPILDLKNRKKDLHWFLRELENATIECLKTYGLKALGNRPDATGVWIGDRKLASIGIAVKSWVTYHGIAINLYQDPLAFQGISPCGFQSSTMISLEEIRTEKIDRKSFQQEWLKNFWQLMDQGQAIDDNTFHF